MRTAFVRIWAASGALSPTATTTATPASAVAQAAKPSIGTFKQVQGNAGIDADTVPQHAQHDVAVALAVGLNVGDRLSTEPQGAATLTRKDGPVLTMGPKSVVDLRHFQFDCTTQQGNFLLDLLLSSVRVLTGLIAKLNPELFKVQTPTSVMGVRGTDFIVETRFAR